MNKRVKYGVRGLVCVALATTAAHCSSPPSGGPSGGENPGSGGSSSLASGGLTGSGGTLALGGFGGGGGTPLSDAGFDACTGVEHEIEEVGGPLDIYRVFDRTGSMGDDCEFELGAAPPTDSKACYATYALPDYLMNVDPSADTRLAFQVLTIAEDESDCDGEPYSTPLLDLTALPVGVDHPLVQRIIDETFEDGDGTHLEGGLRGIAAYTAANQTPGRQMIGVLMTDGEPNGCEEDVEALSDIVAEHYAATGLKTFIIGMEGAENDSLEAYASVGGAEPHDDFCGDGPTPCHYWNVGNGSGEAIASALQAIVGQVVPLPCRYDVSSLTPPAGEELNLGKVNITLTDQNQVTTTIGQVPDAAACPADRPAWHYDDAAAPEFMVLCPTACAQVSGATAGSRVNVVVGCDDTVMIPVF
jgi:hypothetical protein